jgi:hypothetical protein
MKQSVLLDGKQLFQRTICSLTSPPQARLCYQCECFSNREVEMAAATIDIDAMAKKMNRAGAPADYGLDNSKVLSRIWKEIARGKLVTPSRTEKIIAMNRATSSAFWDCHRTRCGCTNSS